LYEDACSLLKLVTLTDRRQHAVDTTFFQQLKRQNSLLVHFTPSKGDFFPLLHHCLLVNCMNCVSLKRELCCM